MLRSLLDTFHLGTLLVSLDIFSLYLQVFDQCSLDHLLRSLNTNRSHHSYSQLLHIGASLTHTTSVKELNFITFKYLGIAYTILRTASIDIALTSQVNISPAVRL